MDLVNDILSVFSTLDSDTLFLVVAFDILLIATFCRRGGVTLLKKRTRSDWVLDVAGLFVQGTAIPWLQVAIVIALMAGVFPDLAGSLSWHPLLSFLFCFVVVDYGYYWNHRLFHRKEFWAIHHVHHSASQMDVLNTSRNTLWTSLLIIYLWVNGVMLYLLADPAIYVFALTLTAVLDLWRHSALEPSGYIKKCLGSVFVLPSDHAWHHSQDIYDINFGANLNLWDRFHGTWHQSEQAPKEIGVVSNLTIFSKLWWPFK